MVAGNMERDTEKHFSLEGTDMDRRMSAGVVVVVALAVGVFLFMLVRQRVMAESEARAALAEVQRLELDQQKSRPIEEARATDFQRKVVYVETSNGFSVPLVDARFKQAGGRSFIVGHAVGHVKDTGIYAQSTLWLPVSEVVRMSEFADIEALHNNRDRVRAHQMEQLRAPPR
jgi:hypothetical protein